MTKMTTTLTVRNEMADNRVKDEGFEQSWTDTHMTDYDELPESMRTILNYLIEGNSVEDLAIKVVQFMTANEFIALKEEVVEYG